MWQTFRKAVFAKYEITAALPSESYPPKNIAMMMDQCRAVGRDDLADQVQENWTNALKDHPKYRLSFGAAVNGGGNYLKKYLFKGKEFILWLKEQEDLSPEMKMKVVDVPLVLKGTPPIAVPKGNETPEMWEAEAAKTKQALVEARQGFSDAKEYIQFLETEVTDLERKIKVYGPGGDKAMTTKGKPSKLAARVPKWEVLLKSVSHLLAENSAALENAESNFSKAADDYAKSPAVTVAYEEKVQDNLENVLEYVLNIKDLTKQRELLEKLNKTLDKQKIGAVTATADMFSSLLNSIKASIASFSKWVMGLGKSVSGFAQIAGLRY